MKFLNDSEAIASSKSVDKQAIAEVIDSYVKDGLSYLEATSKWLEENSIPETMLTKYISSNIIESIKAEAIEDNILRPSLAVLNKSSTLDFLYD